ncbi:hypothetical protein BDD12DRAFT_889909 [Trichophaea hybrida]|nr:hypothetical protein BDD12DRAFT_889909 [Trichophaea hybrida]
MTRMWPCNLIDLLSGSNQMCMVVPGVGALILISKIVGDFQEKYSPHVDFNTCNTTDQNDNAENTESGLTELDTEEGEVVEEDEETGAGDEEDDEDEEDVEEEDEVKEEGNEKEETVSNEDMKHSVIVVAQRQR